MIILSKDTTIQLKMAIQTQYTELAVHVVQMLLIIQSGLRKSQLYSISTDCLIQLLESVVTVWTQWLSSSLTRALMYGWITLGEIGTLDSISTLIRTTIRSIGTSHSTRWASTTNQHWLSLSWPRQKYQIWLTSGTVKARHRCFLPWPKMRNGSEIRLTSSLC